MPPTPARSVSRSSCSSPHPARAADGGGRSPAWVLSAWRGVARTCRSTGSRTSLPAHFSVAGSRSSCSPSHSAVNGRWKQTVLFSANLLHMAKTAASRPEPRQGARERILETAYDLFSRRGIHDVGIDELVERAGVAKATLYKHFSSKDELVLGFLEQREQVWTYGWVETEARRRGATPEEQLLAIFDLF